MMVIWYHIIGKITTYNLILQNSINYQNHIKFSFSRDLWDLFREPHYHLKADVKHVEVHSYWYFMGESTIIAYNHTPHASDIKSLK